MKDNINSVEYQEDLVLNWTPEQVAAWLKNKGHGQYATLLTQQHKIDGISLLLLQEMDLKSSPIGINIIGDVKRIIWDIQCLRVNYYSTMFKFHDKRHTNVIQLTTPEFNNEELEKLHRQYMMLNFKWESWYNCEDEETSFKVHPKPELHKTFIALLYMFTVTWILAFVLVFVNDRVPNSHRYPPLPDIFLDNFPSIPKAFEWSEYCVTFLTVIWIFVCIFHKHRTILCRRFFALMGTMYLLRCATIFVTSLSVPAPHLHCNSQFHTTWTDKFHKAYQIWKGGGLQINGVKTCGDYLFSGHTATITFLNLFITEYTPDRPTKWNVLHILTWTTNIFAMGCILASHEHYTIDVLIGFYLSLRLFLYYHCLANNQALRQSDSSRIKTWFPLFSYFEKSITHRVPNDYSTPRQIFDYISSYVWFHDEPHANQLPVY